MPSTEQPVRSASAPVLAAAPGPAGAYPRPFLLYRRADVTGVSGTGVVATGAQFPDGTVVLRWAGKHASTVIWASLTDAMAVHGHDGKTVALWPDTAAGDGRGQAPS